MGKVLCGVVAFLVCFLNWAHAAYTVKGVNFWSAPDHTRIVAALSKPVNRVDKKLVGKSLIISFNGRIKGRTPRVIRVGDSLIDRIFVRKSGPKTQLIIQLKRIAEYRVFFLRRYRNRPFRIVVDILKSAKEIGKIAHLRKEKAYIAKSKHKYIVVVDPGHGGSDPGAIGLYGLKEKEVVLDISKRVARYCNKDPHIQVFLTRTGDYYVPLTKRVEIAHDYGADLFLSIHSNKAPSSKLSGVMAFTLSSRGIRTGLAKMLEDIENTEELASDIKLKRSNQGINHKVLKVTYDYSVSEGKRAARLITEYVAYFANMENRGLRKASLIVLKNPGIPSLLLEIGFLSNRKDAKKLKSSHFRDRVAYGICEAIKTYFEFKDRIRRSRYYVVRKGDSLWKIARMHKTTVERLKKVNNIKGHVVYPGMKLLIP